MFEGFQGVWTPVDRGASLKPGRSLAVKVAGTPLVFLRRPDGRASALVDRCPHRGVALSLGKVGSDGCLECPFHGWRFDGDGACTHIPLNDVSPEKRPLYNARSVPVRELGGLLWVYTEVGATPMSEPVLPEAMAREKVALWYKIATWKCHWTRAMENMLDSPHLPYVHRNTIGRIVRRKMKEGSVMEMRTTPTAHGYLIESLIDGAPPEGFLNFVRPNAMVLEIPIPNRLWRQHVWCVPVDDTTTRMILVSARDFGLYNPLSRLMDEFNTIILGEDRAVVESSFPVKVPRAGEERSVASDVPTLMFRKYYYRELDEDRRMTAPDSEPARQADVGDTQAHPNH